VSTHRIRKVLVVPRERGSSNRCSPGSWLWSCCDTSRSGRENFHFFFQKKKRQVREKKVRALRDRDRTRVSVCVCVCVWTRDRADTDLQQDISQRVEMRFTGEVEVRARLPTENREQRGKCEGTERER
jgi:hypothetical protein